MQAGAPRTAPTVLFSYVAAARLGVHFTLRVSKWLAMVNSFVNGARFVASLAPAPLMMILFG